MHTESVRGRKRAGGGCGFGRSTSAAVGLGSILSGNLRFSTRETQTTLRGLEIASLFPDTHLSGIPQLSLSSTFFFASQDISLLH